MGYSELSLPIDIPWKRLAVSADMLDTQYGDLKFPAKWDTSIAVFFHEPAETDPAYCKRKITYLKVVCTITNYQMTREDVTVLDALRESWRGSAGFKKFEHAATSAYPCHGALLQVGIYPNPSSDVPLHDYPYISSVQPRKRELYEVATQSGEVASQSQNKLNVLKGSTTTGTQEDYDLDLGGGSGGHSGIFGLWSEQHSGEQRQLGTITRRQTQDQNVATSDASRDRRESFSFSTSINQLHTLLQSFHLGTNRAMFFMQPVPHMQDAKFSFVRGLRRLEGVQEFFLIVNRPAHLKGYCVEIALETAHDFVHRAYVPRLIPASDMYTPANLAKSAGALGTAVLNAPQFAHFRKVRDAWNSFWPHQRWAANRENWEPDYDNPTECLAAEVPGMVPGIGGQDVALIFEQYEASSGRFFVTGRKFCACWLPPESGSDSADAMEEHCEESSPASISSCDPGPGSVIFSGVYDAPIWSGSYDAAYFNAQNFSLQEAVSRTLLSSERQSYGTGTFLTTPFLADELGELFEETGEGGARRTFRDRELDQEAVARLRSLPRGTTVRTVARMPTSELGARLGVSDAEAASLKSKLLVSALKAIGPDRSMIERLRGEADLTHAERERRLFESARGTVQPSREPPATSS